MSFMRLFFSDSENKSTVDFSGSSGHEKKSEPALETSPRCVTPEALTLPPSMFDSSYPERRDFFNQHVFDVFKPAPQCNDPCNRASVCLQR